MSTLYFTITLVLLWALPAAEAQRVTRQHALAQGLVSWWRAVPTLVGGRTWYDLMGHAPGTLTNMAAAGWATPTRPGSVAEVRFDGSNDYVVTPVSARLFPATTTVMMWLRRTATGGSYQTLFAADGVERAIQVTATGVVHYVMHWTTGSFSGDLTAAVSVGPWYHLTMTMSADGGFRFYLNCGEYYFFTPDGSTFIPTTSKAQFGAIDNGGLADFFTGTLDDVRVYNRALAPVEICQAMRDSSQGEPRLLPPSPLLALLGSVPGATGRGSFLPFFQPAQ